MEKNSHLHLLDLENNLMLKNEYLLPKISVDTVTNRPTPAVFLHLPNFGPALAGARSCLKYAGSGKGGVMKKEGEGVDHVISVVGWGT